MAVILLPTQKAMVLTLLPSVEEILTVVEVLSSSQEETLGQPTDVE